MEADSSAVQGDVAPDPPAGRSENAAPPGNDAVASTGGARTVELDGSRLRISLTSFSAAIIIATGLMLLAMGYRIGQDRGFQAGKASYEARVLDEIQRVRQEPPNRELLAGLQQAESGADEPPPRSSARFMVDDGPAADLAAPAWVPGHTYINVQDFAPGSGDDPERVQAFLAERRVETAIIVLEGGWRRLLTTRGYNHADSAQKRLNAALNERVRSLGLQYQKAGGRYDWQDTYFRKLDKESW